ncbi:MAG TPA: histidine kinase [Casimicrobiaceae bacterium]|nr:histidine kinase [Casimicrobiaceae bacterium]
MLLANPSAHTAFLPSRQGAGAPQSGLLGIPGLSLERLGWAAAVAVLLSLWSNTAWMVASGDYDMAEYGARCLGYLQQYAPWVFITTIAGTLADALPLHGARRVAVILLALALGSWAGVVVTAGFECLAAGCYRGPTLFSRGQMAFSLQQVPFTFAQACAFALVHFTWRRDAAVAAALHASEIARVDAERERVQAALHAMQARVEPSFLLATLRDVRARSEADRAAGVRLLDLLIRYLRMALPRGHFGGSTVGRESGLLRAYLDMCALRSDRALAVTCQIDDALADAPFPPMVLGPLVAALAPDPSPRGMLDVTARALDRRARISVAARGEVVARLVASTALAEVRERVIAIYGERASFVVDRSAADAFTIILEIPLDPADRSHR